MHALDIAMRSSDSAWRCDGDQGPLAYRCTKRVLTEMGGVNIPATLDYYDYHYGTSCDCSILTQLTDMTAGRMARHRSARTIRRISTLFFFCVRSRADLGR